MAAEEVGWPLKRAHVDIGFDLAVEAWSDDHGTRKFGFFDEEARDDSRLRHDLLHGFHRHDQHPSRGIDHHITNSMVGYLWRVLQVQRLPPPRLQWIVVCCWRAK
jgi:hypothetical protein